MAKQKLVVKVLGLLLLVVSTRAMAWWNEEWPYRLPIVLDTTATGASVQGSVDNATILVKLHSGNFQDFFLVNQNLSDVRFLAADDKTQLDFEIESADLINQLIYIWVKIPRVGGNLNTERIWMYYGNASAVAPSTIQPPYNPGVAAVYHMSDVQDGVADSTVNVYQIELPESVTPEPGIIAGGINAGGVEGLRTPVINELTGAATSGFTASFWIKPTSVETRATLMAIGDANLNLNVVMTMNQLQLTANNGTTESIAAGSLKASTWHHVAVTYDGAVAQLYLDSAPVAQLEGVTPPATSSLVLGADMQNAEPFAGSLDELRIDSAPRTSDDIKLQYASQSIMGNLLKFQQGEQLGSGGGSGGFWSVIIGSTESSGWTIIAMLGVMAAISWMVMFGKALFIRSVGKDNTAFLEQYRNHAGDDPALLDHAETQDDKDLEDSPILQAVFGDHDHFQSSPIYRVYHRGIQEVRSRLGTSVGARAAGLSPSAISAIKAAVDAQMIREAQRINSKMVLLTIAISGGPFLGLMGTVVGVMITFAAIAATGDVNISAIAPGVAAALLTTVAGLVVAIPALFGYNYLATRIKESISDMRVFADEFVTRLAEYYGN